MDWWGAMMKFEKLIHMAERPPRADKSAVGNVVSRLVGSKMSPAPQQPAMGFFTDTSLCIGCKACEVACKQWN